MMILNEQLNKADTNESGLNPPNNCQHVLIDWRGRSIVDVLYAPTFLSFPCLYPERIQFAAIFERNIEESILNI